MAEIHIQWHPAMSGGLDEMVVKSLFQSIAEADPSMTLTTSAGDDNGRYINFELHSDNAERTWDEVRRQAFEQSSIGVALAGSTIVVTEGPNGWEDYLLLHHYGMPDAKK